MEIYRGKMRNNHIDDIQQGGLLTANGFESSPCDGAGPNISAYLFGDWREEKK